MLKIPVLRGGRPYESKTTTVLSHVATGEPVVEVSQANPGLIDRDLLDAPAHRAALRELPVAELIAICKRAAALFVGGILPVDPRGGATQSPDDYVRSLSATTGMPESLCRGNMKKIHFVLDEMERVVTGLARGVDLRVLDDGWVEQDGRIVSYRGQADTLGVILPSNSPGVHSLWIPSIALKVPLILKPGRQEPWTPLRIAHALMEAGCPREAIGFYPTDYSGASQILLRCDRGMMFGDESTVRPWKDDRRIELHGPGWSKVLVCEDRSADWQSSLDVMVSSIADNGGRSCINASGVWTTAHGADIAEALAERLARVEALPLDHPDAAVAAFSDPTVAHRISAMIDGMLATPGAEDVTAKYRDGGRVAEAHGCTYLLPTIVRCDDPEHPIARTELLFPFASVVQVPQDRMLDAIGPTLVASGLTRDDDIARRLMTARHIERLNLGDLPTSRVSWDQPHEGNLFEHLYRQRAFQSPDTVPAA